MNEVASNVGQGWSLLAGGIVTRMQVGEPDDQMKSGNSSPFDINKYPNGYLYAAMPASNGCPEALTKYPIFKEKNQLYAQHNDLAEDKQLDYFSFQFNGKAGMFVLDKNTNTGLSLGDTKIRISFQTDAAGANAEGVRTTISQFTIQDIDGLIYRFNKKSWTRIFNMKYCDARLIQSQRQPKFENNNVYHQAAFDEVSVKPWIVNSWALTEIEDPFTHRKITFSYTAFREVDSRAGEDISFNQGEKEYILITHRRSRTKTPEIESINFPDGHKVAFGYSPKERHDLTGEQPLSSIETTYQGRYLSRHILRTSYFILNRYGTPTSEYEKRVARLCLQSVQKIGPDLKEESAPYRFEYNLGSSNAGDFVPPAFYHLKDIWGFFNGSNSAGYNGEPIRFELSPSQLSFNQLKGLCFLRNSGGNQVYDHYTAKPGWAKNGLLKQIVYPTGGTLQYEYAQNYGVIDGATRACAGVHVSSTATTDGGYSNGCSNPLITNYYFTLNTSGTSSLWGLETPITAQTNYNHFEPADKYYHWTWSSLPFGECAYRYKFPGILSVQQAIDLPEWIQVMNTIAPVLGILNVISFIKDLITVCTGGSAVALIIDVVLGLVQTFVSCFVSQAQDKSTTTYYSYDLNSGNPLPTQFKRVEVVEGSGTRGRTIQEFTSDADYPIWESNSAAFSQRQRFAPWAYGLPSKTIIKDASNNTVSETENTYNFGTEYGASHCNSTTPRYRRYLLLKQPLSTLSCKCAVVKFSSQRSDEWVNPALYNDVNTYTSTSDPSTMNVEKYDLYTGRTELVQTVERKRSTANPAAFVETIKRFIYNDENYQVSIINTTESNGKQWQKNLFYTIDFVKMHRYCYQVAPETTTNPQIIALVQNNVLNQVVETNELVIDPSPTANYYNYLRDQATVYMTAANGNILPSKTLEMRFDQPTSLTSPWPVEYPLISNGEFLRITAPLLDPENPDYSRYKIAQSFTYDAQANLLAVSNEGNQQVSNIYGYNDKYVVASLINALPFVNKYGYADFEDQSPAYGWTIQLPSGVPQYTNVCVTGNRALLLPGGGGLNATLNPLESYIVSFWAMNNPVVSAGAVLKKTEAGASGFIYYEYEIPNGTSSVTISGPAQLDQVRFYPTSSRMRTVAYDPVFGKTADCDENNRITYYEYDNLGRLRFVKDDKKNVVKMYEYNSVSPAKLNGCPGLYYNFAISETFTKNNCGAGYVGSDVTVSVPANTYSSSFSQADADAQAENYLLANGQTTANNTGTCTLLYYNTAQTQTFKSNGCSEGYVGGTVTYSVPANRYSSTTSQAAADQLALDEIAANGQAYADDPANTVCLIDYDPHWVAEGNAPTKCLWYNGQPYIYQLATDVNPNSSTYGQPSWQNTGLPGNCPQPICNNCTDPLQRCVNGVCEYAQKVCTSSYYDSGAAMFVNDYYYKWSDGVRTPLYSEYDFCNCQGTLCF